LPNVRATSQSSPNPAKRKTQAVKRPVAVSDDDDDEDLNHLPPAQRQAEVERRQQRLKRFKMQEIIRLEQKQKAQMEVAKQRATFIAGGQEGNPDIIDWDKDTIVGTSTKL
jgi:hypothetical protein